MINEQFPPSQNHKNLLIIIIFTIVLLFASAGIFFFLKSSKIKNQLGQKLGQQVVGISNQVSNEAKVESTNKEMEVCQGQNKDTCFKNAAFKANNQDLCEKIGDTQLKESCKSIIISGKINNDQPVDICKQLTQVSTRTECYAQKYDLIDEWTACVQGDSDKAGSCLKDLFSKEAQKKNDKILCDALVDSDLISCLSFFSKN